MFDSYQDRYVCTNAQFGFQVGAFVNLFTFYRNYFYYLILVTLYPIVLHIPEDNYIYLQISQGKILSKIILSEHIF